MKSEKVKCAECGFKAHILIPHLLKEHKLTAVEYLEKFGGVNEAPLWSAYGLEKIREANPASKHAVAPRPRKNVPIKDLLPMLKKSGFEVVGEYSIFTEPGELTPQLDPHFVWPVEQVLDLMTILEKKERNRPWMKGWSGTGKTMLIRQLAGLCNANLWEINGDTFMQRSSLIGRWIVRNGETIWQDGIIPAAMRSGGWLLVNEADCLSPDCMNVLKTVLEDPSRLTIPENGNEVLYAHPDFRIIATANTWARGDSSGLFVNTHTQSDADARRWSARILLDYLEPHVEVKMLRGYFDALEDDDAQKFVEVANKVREAFKADRIDKTFSPAELINWAENYIVCGKGVHHAARISFLNALEPDVATAISEMVVAIFGNEET